MLAVAAGNVAALDARAVVYCELTGESTLMSGAVEASQRARTVTTAAGAIAEVARLFALLAASDVSDVLAQFRRAPQRAQSFQGNQEQA